MTTLQLLPHAALLVALTVLTVLVLREGYRGRHTPGHGHTRPHSAGVGSATDDKTAINREDAA